jgi:hypothetical protein
MAKPELQGLYEEWEASDDEQRQTWLKEAEDMYIEVGKVPENSVHSFAVVWGWARKKKPRKWSKTMSPLGKRSEPEDSTP